MPAGHLPSARAPANLPAGRPATTTTLPKIAVADEASDMFNVVRDNRSRLAGSPRTVILNAKYF
uniref:Uncharacterized protein n=1 Tax=Oryza rufipogon TaxID=4529 RepID=A0A0E0Q3Y3_ORYRU